MNSLLTTPNDQQRELLQVIWDAAMVENRWPIYQFVERTLYRRGVRPDAWALIRDCPWVPSLSGVSQYGWLWLSNGIQTNPAPDDTVGLTVLGLFHVGAAYECNMFITALRLLVEGERSVVPSPTVVQPVEISAADLAPSLFPRPPFRGVTGGMRAADLALLGEMLRHEPSTRRYIDRSGAPPDANWKLELTPFIRAYEGVKSAEEYAERLVADLSPAEPERRPEPVSSLALPEAIDYLNAIWHLRFGQELFGIPRCAGAAELTAECQSSVEFDSRMTALYGILSQIRIPRGPWTAKPARLKKFLLSHPVLKERASAIDSVDTMDTFLRARAWRQHVEAADGIDAMRRLGVTVPTDDWGSAWRTMQARLVETLNTLRQEADLLPVAPRRNTS